MNIEAITKDTASEINDIGKEMSKTTVDFDSRIKVAETAYPEKKGENDNKLETNKKGDSKKEYNPDNRVDVKNEENLDYIVKEYFQEIKDYSDYPDTIADKTFEVSDLEKTSPEKVAQKHHEFSNKEFKNELIVKWEETTGKDWPRYKEDLYITNKTGEVVKIREAGQRYDAHHIQPLSMGGLNDASNITPLSADVHMDHRGVHSRDGAFGKLEKILGEKN